MADTESRCRNCPEKKVETAHSDWGYSGARAGRRRLLCHLFGHDSWRRRKAAHAEEPTVAALPDIAFVPVDPVVISLGQAARSTHLRMTSQLEVAKPYADEVTMLMPRILDVLNSYLRAVEVAQLEDPTALVRLRSHMLRRIQIVTGEGRVRDLLITEFILN